MNRQSTADLINEMSVVYYDTDSAEDGEFIYIITVEDTDKNRDVIRKLGYSNEQIDAFISYRDNEIDLSFFVWLYVDWYDGKKYLFLLIVFLY